MKMNHLPKAGALLALSLTLSLGAQASQPEDPAAHPDRIAKVEAVAVEKEVPWKAKGMAPLHAMAHFVARDADDSRKYMWKLNVYVPKVTWETAGDGPPIKDPRLAGLLLVAPPAARLHTPSSPENKASPMAPVHEDISDTEKDPDPLTMTIEERLRVSNLVK